MAAAPGNDALAAIVPQYADFDAWTQLLWPGGVFARGFIQDWGELVQILDAGDICGLAGVSGSACTVTRLATRGVKRVDGPQADFLYREAIEQHLTPDVAGAVARAEFRDAGFGDSGETVSSLSINGYRAGIEGSGVPIFLWAAWHDAATVDGALALFSSFSNPVRLVIGPWSHGGGEHTDPFLPEDAPPEPSSAEQHRMLIDFMDHYVKGEGRQDGEGVGEIRYWTFNECWKTTPSWPPSGPRPTRWYFGEGGTLSAAAPPPGGASDEYPVDFSHSTGTRTRWHTQLGGGDVVYGDRAGADGRRLTYTSEPLATAVEITGTVEVDLHVASTHADGAFFGYLEVVDPEGVSRYITEGQIRAVHRRECSGTPPYPQWGPCHTFREADGAPLVPGETARVRFGMIATSVLVPAGHRIRIALAGHDDAVFHRYPESGDPVWTVQRNLRRPSGVVIPLAVR
jgi:putative CocE/NonD family hydrolase